MPWLHTLFMSAALLLGSANGLSKNLYVHIKDFSTKKDISNVVVTIDERLPVSGEPYNKYHKRVDPRSFRATTNSKGIAQFQLPSDLQHYEISLKVPAKYAAPRETYYASDYKNHQSLIEDTNDTTGSRHLTLYLVPESILKVRNESQAIEMAKALPKIHKIVATPGLRITANKTTGIGWGVQFETADRQSMRIVEVDAIDGSATYVGGWRNFPDDILP